MPVAPPATTTSTALTRLQKTVSLTSGTGVVVGMSLVIGAEVCLVQVLVKSDGSIVEVERGQFGTAAKPHLSGTAVYLSSTALPPTYVFGRANNRTTLRNDVTNNLPDLPLPVGSSVIDPDTGYEYVTVDCQEAMTVGEWVKIDELGLATPLNAASVGRVGIITQAVSASDNFALALVVGKYAGAQVSSLSSLAPPNWIAAYGTVSGVAFVVPGGTSAIATVSGSAPGVNLIFGALFLAETTSGVSSGTTLPGITVFLNNPWVQGLGLFTS